MNRTRVAASWRRNRFAIAAVLLCLLGIAAMLLQKKTALQSAEVDRLRMMAGTGRDPAALDRLRQAAQQGNTEALRAAAAVLVPDKDRSAALQGLEFARIAARRGDRAAQYLLAKTLFDGSAVQQQDWQQARVWFEKSALQQHSQAAYFLGLIYKNGYGVAVDQKVAAQWFTRAVALENADAMFMLANAYMAGEGVAPDQNHAVRLLQQAAALEHPLASQTLGYALHDGTLGLVRDERQSAEMMLEVEHALRHPRSAF